MTSRNVQMQTKNGIDGKIALLAMVLAVALLTFEITPEMRQAAPIRAVLGFVAGFVAPGYLVLRLAKVTRVRFSKLLLLAVGVSITILVLVALGTNYLFTALGSDHPLAIVPWVHAGVLFGLSGAVLLSDSAQEPSSCFPPAFSRRMLLSGVFLTVLPFVAISAAYARNVADDSVPMFVFIALVAVVVLLVAVRVVPSGLHPFAIWAVAVAVLLQMTLITSHIWGWDVHFEYATAHTILADGHWDPGFGSPTNSLLSVTFLAAVAAEVTGLELVWIFKLLFPVLASLLPVAVYHLASVEFADDWVAALSPYALIFYYGYFKNIPGKQVFSQLFLVLLLLTAFDRSFGGKRGRALSVAFAGMFLVSHYGFSLLFVLFLGAVVVSVRLAVRLGVVDPPEEYLVRPTLVQLLAVGWVAWYLFTADGTNFERVVRIGRAMVTNFGDISGRSGVGYATKTFRSSVWLGYQALSAILVGCVGLGVLRTGYAISFSEDTETDPEYVLLATFLCAFLVSGLLLSYGLGFDRILLLVLATLAPFTVTGFRTLLLGVTLVPRKLLAAAHSGPAVFPSRQTSLRLFAVFLAVLFVFSSGGAFTFTGADEPSYSINLDEEAGWPVYDSSEVAATRWLDSNVQSGTDVAVFNQWSQVKSRDGLLVREVIESRQVGLVWPAQTRLACRSYIYVSDRPMVRAVGSRNYIEPRETTFYREVIRPSDRIYASGTAAVYRSRSTVRERGPSENC
ncbi:DUF2206 domain-containing protein [Haloarcula amylovorans]|uniref:DUF2206 domain-containing protein n=1 Tax=Haloarcula amylovorans TaxID=2562280 RepID=UPI0010766925|nr:DUF2206 domain-containing protein [Halomicroarcula amylolytica]